MAPIFGSFALCESHFFIPFLSITITIIQPSSFSQFLIGAPYPFFRVLCDNRRGQSWIFNMGTCQKSRS